MELGAKSSIGTISGLGLMMMDGILRVPFTLADAVELPLTNVEQVSRRLMSSVADFNTSFSPFSETLMSALVALASALICSLLCLFRFFRTFLNPQMIEPLRKTSKINGMITVVMVQVQCTYPMM